MTTEQQERRPETFLEHVAKQVHNKQLQQTTIRENSLNRSLTSAITRLNDTDLSALTEYLIKGLGTDQGLDTKHGWTVDTRDTALIFLKALPLNKVPPEIVKDAYIDTLTTQNENASPVGSIDSLLDAGKIIAPYIASDISTHKAIEDAWSTIAQRMEKEKEWKFISHKVEEMKICMGLIFIEQHSLRPKNDADFVFDLYTSNPDMTLDEVERKITEKVTHKKFDRAVKKRQLAYLHHREYLQGKYSSSQEDIYWLRKQGLISREKRERQPIVKVLTERQKQMRREKDERNEMIIALYMNGTDVVDIANQFNLEPKTIHNMIFTQRRKGILIHRPIKRRERAPHTTREKKDRRSGELNTKHSEQITYTLSPEEIDWIIRTALITDSGSSKNLLTSLNHVLKNWDIDVEIIAPQIFSYMNFSKEKAPHVSLPKVLKEWKILTPYIAQDPTLNLQLLSSWNKIADILKRDPSQSKIIAEVEGIQLRQGLLFLEDAVKAYHWPYMPPLFAALTHNPEMSLRQMEKIIKTMELYDREPNIAKRRQIVLINYSRGKPVNKIAASLQKSITLVSHDRQFLRDNKLIEEKYPSNLDLNQIKIQLGHAYIEKNFAEGEQAITKQIYELHLLGKTHKEIAQQARVSESTVYRSLFALKEIIERQKSGPKQAVMTPRRKQILEMIQQNPEITYREIASHLGSSEDNVKQLLRKLRSQGFLLSKTARVEQERQQLLALGLDVTNVQIAEVLEIPLTTVRTRINNLRKRRLRENKREAASKEKAERQEKLKKRGLGVLTQAESAKLATEFCVSIKTIQKDMAELRSQKRAEAIELPQAGVIFDANKST